MPREKAQAAPTARPKVPMRRRGAHCPVVVMKRGNARGAKGAGHRRLTWANRVKLGGAQNVSGRRQPWCGDTSRMNREVHVRICEGLGVKFTGPTRQSRIWVIFARQMPPTPTAHSESDSTPNAAARLASDD